MAKKSTVNKAGNYTKPGMRKRIFNRIKAGGKGGNPGQWSARKAQMLAKAYKAAGGGYKEEGGKIMPKYKKGGGTFKPHMMYKGDKTVKANTYQEHLDYGKKGYVHSKKKELGGMLKGPSHAEGGIPIEVEGGEYIIKKKSVNKRTEPVLEYINENGKLPGNMDYNFPTTDARDRSKK